MYCTQTIEMLLVPYRSSFTYFECQCKQLSDTIAEKITQIVSCIFICKLQDKLYYNMYTYNRIQQE